MMTNEEVALGLSQKYGAPKNKNREIAVYQSCIEMAEWKDAQFKKYLENKYIEARNSYDKTEAKFYEDRMDYINELFEEIEQDNSDRE